jgi:hypothetical protein
MHTGFAGPAVPYSAMTGATFGVELGSRVFGDLRRGNPRDGLVSGELLGEPSAELRAKMADSEVRLFTALQSM